MRLTSGAHTKIAVARHLLALTQFGPSYRGATVMEASLAASALRQQLGALHEVEKVNGPFVIRGRGCLLAAAVHGRPEVCRAFDSLLTELLEVPVRECCERGERPRCCFEIMPLPESLVAVPGTISPSEAGPA